MRAPGPRVGLGSATGIGDRDYTFSYPMFRDLEKRQTSFTAIAAHVNFRANLSSAGKTRAGVGMLVSGNYFRALDIKPALGRFIRPRDEPRVGESAVVVLSYGYWHTYFGADSSVLGRKLTVNGQRLTIIGVAPAGFTGTTIGVRPNVFVPLTLRWLMQPTRPKDQDNRLSYWLYLFARLKPSVSVQRASASLNTLYSGIINEVEAPLVSGALSDTRMKKFRKRRLVLEPGARGESSVPEHVAQPLTLLLGVTVLVLLIVCVNVANLLLASGASRVGELAVRASLGATRRRLVLQLLAESTALALLGGVASIPVAAATLSGVIAILPPTINDLLSIGLSRPALWFAAAASLGTVLLFGVIPALQSTRTDLAHMAKGQGPRSVGGHGFARFRRLLAMTQIAFSMILLVLAGLFTRSLMNIAQADLGMNVDSLATFSVSPRLNGYDQTHLMNLYKRIEKQLAAQPGVVNVTTSAVPLISNSAMDTQLSIDSSGQKADAAFNEVGVNFFRTLSIPLLTGRAFAESDKRGAPRIAVVNKSFVRKFHLGANAIGTHFRPGISGQDIEIVGVAADAKYRSVKGKIPAQYFLPRLQDDKLGTLWFYVRANVAPASLLRVIPGVVERIDPNLPVSGLMTMHQAIQTNVFLDRLEAILSAIFAGLATLLAAIGLYGVLVYNVTQRTRELGLRLALGASPSRLRAMILRQVGFMAVIGGLIGLVAALGLGRIAGALLFGLTGYDPIVLIGATVVLAAVVFAAGYLPARRASRVAPMEALREE